MPDDPKPELVYSIFVPILNEEENIEPLYDEIRQVMEKIGETFECIFVNDGSTDKSAAILDRMAKNDDRIKILHFVRNFGQTAATSAAIDISAGKFLIGMDGDRQNDPNDIPRLIDKLSEGYDIVTGWRKERQDKAMTRVVPSKVANWLISRISGVKLHDFGCSLKIYRRQIIKNIRLYGDMHRFIPIYVTWMGGKSTELQVNHRPRVAGRSKYGLLRIFKVILDLLLVRFLDRYLTKPIHFFGGWGLFFIFVSMTFGFLALYLKIFEKVSFIITPLPLMSAMLFLIGVLLILMGVLAELVVRTYFEGQQKRTYIITDSSDRAEG